MRSKTKCIKALWNRAAPKHGSLKWLFTHDQMTDCDGLQPHYLLHMITIFSGLFCTFVGNVDKPLSPSSEWFWSLNKHQSKVIQAHTKRKMISTPPQPKHRWGRKEGTKKLELLWRGDLSVCCVTKVKHEYKSRLGALVEVVGEASWGVAEVSFFIRGCRDFFFPFKHQSKAEVSVAD